MAASNFFYDDDDDLLHLLVTRFVCDDVPRYKIEYNTHFFRHIFYFVFLCMPAWRRPAH